MESALYFTLFLLLIPVFLFLRRRRPSERPPLPPGSMGIPFLGQSQGFLRAMRTNKGEEWFKERVAKYGQISKLNLFGAPTVFLHGVAANKFVYTCDGDTLANHQPVSVRRILGDKNLFEVSPEDHKRVRQALMTFLKPEALKEYVGKIDEEVRRHLNMYWDGKQEVEVMPLMKTLTFDVICSVIFGMERGERRELLVHLFEVSMEGILSIPVNLPFTRFRRSIEASAKIKAIIRDLIQEKRQALAKNGAPTKRQDLITSLLSLHENGLPLLSDEEIVDNTYIIMIGGHDTSSVLLTFLVRLLANDPSIYANILQEQEEIAKSKGPEMVLTWEDLTKMKYTWTVAIETLRIWPPVFCTFRQTIKDFEFGGYLIPKGYQVVWAAFMTHMDEKIFPEPSKFDSSRSEQGTKTPFSFVAFGGGSRSCPGYEFARIETLILMHYLVTRFTWKLSLEDDSFKRDPLPVFIRGLPIKLEQKCMD